MDQIEKVASVLYKKGYQLVGCSKREVERIEEEFNLKLPAAYKEFLYLMGKKAGGFMLGSSCFYDEIFLLQQDAIDLLEENDFKTMPENSFVFWMHQGYQFCFFLTTDGDNPPIYHYTEVSHNNNNPEFVLKEKSFADFLETMLEW